MVAMIRSKAFWIVLLALLMGFVPTASQAARLETNVSDMIQADTTWTAAGSPYIVTGNIIVENSSTLTIEPGVEVRFAGIFYIAIAEGSSLIAEGTAAKPIKFTGSNQVAGSWETLEFRGNATGKFGYCDIGYGGNTKYGSSAMIRIGSAGVNTNVSIHDCRIHDSLTDGIDISTRGSSPTITNSQIDHNAMFPIEQIAIDMTPTYTNLNLNNNGTDAVLISGDQLNRDVTLDSQSSLNGKPFIARWHIDVETGKTLTIKPGTELRFQGNYEFIIRSGGSLIAEGTATQPITITNSIKAPGSWQNIFFSNGAIGRLAYCDIGYAGSSGNGTFRVWNADLKVDHCRIHDSLDRGFVFELESRGSSPSITNTQIDHNAKAAITQTTIDMTPTYTNLNLNNNGSDAVVISDGYLSRNVTLDSQASLNGKPFIATWHIDVETGNTLTIKPGTELRFQGNYEFIIRNGGRLIAEGTATQPITITNSIKTPGSWQNIFFSNGAIGRLAYCDIGYAGSNGNGTFRVWNADLKVDHCRIHDSLDRGFVFELESRGSSPSITNTQIDHNAKAAITQTTIDMTPTYTNLNLNNNGSDAVVISGGDLSRNVTLDSQASLNGKPFITTENISIPADNTLTIKPGTELRFQGNYELSVQQGGSLIAKGTAAQPVRFTSSTPTAGSWQDIFFSKGAIGRFDYCEIAYAGSTNNGALRIWSSDVQIRHCKIHHNKAAAISAENGAQPLIKYNQITQNGFGVRNSSAPSSSSLSPRNLQQASSDVDARENWWGDASGPLHPTLNPKGLGDAVSDGVLFDPWYTTPEGNGGTTKYYVNLPLVIGAVGQ